MKRTLLHQVTATHVKRQEGRRWGPAGRSWGPGGLALPAVLVLCLGQPGLYAGPLVVVKAENALSFTLVATHGAAMPAHAHVEAGLPALFWSTPFTVTTFAGPGQSVTVSLEAQHLVGPHGEPAPGPLWAAPVWWVGGAFRGVVAAPAGAALLHGWHDDVFAGTLTVTFAPLPAPPGVITGFTFVAAGRHDPENCEALTAVCTGQQAWPPTPSQAVSSAALVIDGGTYDVAISIVATGISRFDLLGAQIRLGEPGQNGPAIFDLGGGPEWTELEDGSLARLFDAPFPPQYYNALVTGNTYVNLETIQYPMGEIRGQLLQPTLYSNSGDLNDPFKVTRAGGHCDVDGDASDVQTALGLSVNGWSTLATANHSLADDFEVPPGQIWVIDGITLYLYQTDATTPTITSVDYAFSPIDLLGQPQPPWTNVPAAPTLTDTFKKRDTDLPSGYCGRRAQHVFVPISPAYEAQEGRHWLAWRSNGSTGYSGPWNPPVVIPGQNQKPGANGLLSSAGAPYAYVYDSGPAGTQQDFVFQLTGFAIDAAEQSVLWDTGAPHEVVYNGQTIYLGFSSGNLPDKPQRWAAIPFRIPPAGAVITRIDVDWFISAGYEAATVNYIIWQRQGLAPPQPGHEVSFGVLGPYAVGVDDPRVPELDDWLHSYPGLNIPLASGDYYLTIYAEGIGPGNTTGYSDTPWLTGGDLQDEALEQPFMWRSASFPTPGFEPYDNPAIQPTPGQDPDDRWNPCFAIWGVINGQGDPPQIVVQPAWTAVLVGQDAALSVTASGTAPLSYQWFYGGLPVAGATSSTLVVQNAQHFNHGNYYCEVSNAWGTACSASVKLEVYVEGRPPPVTLGCCFIPDVWLAPAVPWNRDSDQNKIDDLIDAAPSGPQDIIVDFRVCIEDWHLDMLENLSTGSVQYKFCMVTAVAMTGVSYGDIVALATEPYIALIERQIGFTAALDVSLPTIRVTGPPGCPPGGESVSGCFPTMDGSGVNVVVMDTGVDDPGFVGFLGPGVTHATFAGATSGGFNVVGVPLPLPVGPQPNPDDDNGHGTHVASIILGRGAGSVSRGVAPGAGLIDVKVLDALGNGGTYPIMYALERLGGDLSANTDVICMAFCANEWSNGVESFSQMINRAVDLGHVVVAASAAPMPGPPPLTTDVNYPPAAADLAIAVTALDDGGTPDPADDVLAPVSMPGPRDSDGDFDLMDEIKPEVTAPGVDIEAAASDSVDGAVEMSGTSMAAAHVAGLAALAIQSRPSINAFSVRQGILVTSELPPGVFPTPPGAGLGWNDEWGFGVVDAYGLLDAVGCLADPRLERGPAPPQNPWDPGDPPWEIIEAFPYPAISGDDVTLTVHIRNPGPFPARDVHVKFGVYSFSTGYGRSFRHLGTEVVTEIPVSAPAVAVSHTFKMRDYDVCVKVEIGYFCDTNYGNNEAERNIHPTASPVYFQMQNFASAGPLEITFVPLEPHADWTVQITPSTVTLDPNDNPVTIEVLPIPVFGLPDGTTERINIGAYGGGMLLGGVIVEAIMRDCNGNGIDDWFDIRDGTSLDVNGDGIPDECLLGDLDCNGWVDFEDINPFVLAIADPVAYQTAYPDCNFLNGDCNGDGIVDFDDINPFVVLLSGG
jgi:hypothetical protein